VTQARIGFVGLGMMGRDMAKKLVEKGIPLSVVASRRGKGREIASFPLN
jgi:3-hydroxyisobutyrate dehydrogenase-like beta-hydroxyacid dehydrogenase